jgi:hypothetical protein
MTREQQLDRNRRAHQGVDDDLAPAEAPPKAVDPLWSAAGRARLQMKMMIGRADDPLERAADELASRLAGDGALWSATDAGERDGETLHRSAAVEDRLGGQAAEPDTASAIRSARGGGRPLPSALQESLGSALGVDLSPVRLHSGPSADRLNRSLDAAAFTYGTDIFFRGGGDPTAAGSRRLLAHELAHVAQQSGGHAVQRSIFSKKPKDPAEEARKQQEAEDRKKAKAQAKAQKVSDQQQKKAEKTKRKENRKASKEAEKGVDKENKAERKRGVAERKERMKEAEGTAQTGEVQRDLQRRFEAKLAEEEAYFQKLLGDGIAKPKAADLAYRRFWMDDGPDADPDLRAFRPTRQTAAERLLREVKEFRTENNVVSDSLENVALGQTLPSRVESVYEQYEFRIAELVKRGFKQTDAEEQAEFIWTVDNPKIAKERPPVGSALDLAAREEARERIKIRPPIVHKRTSKYDNVKQGKERWVNPVTDGVSGVGEQGSKVATFVQGEHDGTLGDAPVQAPGEAGQLQKLGAGGADLQAKISKAQDRVAKGQKSDPAYDPSTQKQVSDGVGSVLAIFNDITSGVSDIFSFIDQSKKAWQDPDSHSILAVTKTGVGHVNRALRMTTNAAKLAQAIDPGVASTIATFVPGLNIATSALTLTSNAISMANLAIRVNEVNTGLYDVRSRNDDPGQVDALVYPFLKLHASFSKQLEQSVWSTSKSIADLAVSIATIASGGGYGIPTAVQAGVNVVDMMHSLAHLIADNVIAAQVQKNRKDSLQNLEGSAEALLKTDPSAAVDAILTAAMKNKDEVALAFVRHYGIKPESINDKSLRDHRAAILKQIGEDADPKLFYQKWRDAFVSMKDTLAGVGKKYGSIDQLAKDREALDGKKRGCGWRFKMMFKRQRKLNRSIKKTSINTKDQFPVQGPAPDPQGNVQQSNFGFDLDDPTRTQQVEACAGKARLLVGATEQQRKVFESQVDAMDDDTIEAAAKDPRNSDDWQAFFAGVLEDRLFEGFRKTFAA